MAKRYVYLSLVALLIVPYTGFAVDGASSLGLSETAVKIRDEVDIGRMRKDIARLSNLATRVTGYTEAASASKYIFDQFVEIGLQNVESREFPIVVPRDYGDGKAEIFTTDGALLKTYNLWPIWPNLVRTSLLPNGISHLVTSGETLESIAASFQVDTQSILNATENRYLQAQATDGRDNDGDGEIDEPGELMLVDGNSVFIPTGGLVAPVFYARSGELADFNGKNIGGFWYTVQPGDTLWKISEKVYGNGRRWQEIFDLNKDRVRSPSDLVVGVELRMP